MRANRGGNFRDLDDRAKDLQGDLEIQTIQFFHEYTTLAQVNAALAIALGGLLGLMAFLAQEQIHFVIGVIIVGFSLAPAPFSVLFLWYKWKTHTKTLFDGIDQLAKDVHKPL